LRAGGDFRYRFRFAIANFLMSPKLGRHAPHPIPLRAKALRRIDLPAGWR
jgi:hypothetical protein